MMTEIALLGVMSLGGIPATSAEDRPGPNGTVSGGRLVDGAREPERILESSAWDSLFAFLVSVTKGKTDPSDPEVGDFVRANLYMSARDSGILLTVAKRTRARIVQLENRPNKAFEAERGMETELGEEGGKLRQQQTARVTLEARDEILRRVSPLGAKALLRYMAAVVKPGLTVQVEE